MRIGFVICSRYKSRRVPGKALLKINGKPLLWHLIDRLIKIKSPVVLAIPKDEFNHYAETINRYGTDLIVYLGSESDPLLRMERAAAMAGLDHVVRVTHDKVFIDPECYTEMLNEYMTRGLDYAYSSMLPAGTGFEIISYKTLLEATKHYKDVEHISYAIKAVTKNKMDIYLKTSILTEARFLVDFPEDVTFMQTLFACLGNDCTFTDAASFCYVNPWVIRLNALPKYTVYTCALNAEQTIGETINRVTQQSCFNETEYLLIDDFSSDSTSLQMAHVASIYPNIKYIRNDENIGLASSSNVALKHARGKYIIRIDADDYFTRLDAVENMAKEIDSRNLDAVYPGFYDGEIGVVGDPKTNHHVAGALFKTRALNHIKFTERLRNYDGLDLFLRAKSQLDIGYLQGPYFFYRHTDGSMSRTNLKTRAEVKANLEVLNGL